VPLGPIEWLACLVIGAFSLVIGFLLRLWPMPEAIDNAKYNVEIKGAESEKKALQKNAKHEKKSKKSHHDKKH
jgi:hypothetical protein